MTDLEKYEKVNQTENLTELANVIRSFTNVRGKVMGKTRSFDAERMATNCEYYNLLAHNTITREFGIRQQAMMHLFYNDK